MRLMTSRVALAFLVVGFGGCIQRSSVLDDAESLGLKLSEGPLIFRGEAIYDFMDGAGELPLSYGFCKLISATYEKNGTMLSVVVFEMKNARSAFGYYSVLDRFPSEVFVENSLRLLPRREVISWKGRWVFVARVESGRAQSSELLELARTAISALSGAYEEPPLLRCLPEKGKIPRTELYTRGRFAFERAILFLPDNPLGVRKETEAVSAEYADAGKLVVVHYRKSSKARRAFKILQNRGFLAKWKGQFLAFVLEPRDVGRADLLLGKVELE